MHLSIPLLLLILTVVNSDPDADQESKRLMILLKNSIDLKQIEALKAFTDPKFEWDTCKKVLDYRQYMEMLRTKAAAETVNTHWSVINVRQKSRDLLYFTIHTNGPKSAYYPDWHFEAKRNIEMKNKFVLTRGKLDKCGKLDERS